MTPDRARQIDAYIDGELTPQEVAELAAWIDSSAENAALFAEKTLLHSRLMDTALWHNIAASAGAGSHAFPTPPRRAWAPYLAAASIVLLFVGVISLLVALGGHGAVEPRPVPVATLVDSRDAVWDAGDVPTAVGSQLPGGFLRLKSGTAQIEFFSGAQVTLAGPAEFGLNSPGRGFLKRGRLTAYCPKSARGFTIAAPGLSVIDLGTRFGLSVDEKGVPRVLVTEGEVQLAVDGDSSTAHRYTAGQAVQLTHGGQLEAVEALPGEFGDATAVAPWDWSGAVGYYDFEPQPGDGGILVNKVGNSAASDAAVRFMQQTQGRVAGKPVLAFDGKRSAVSIDIPGTFPEVTFAAWVRLNRYAAKVSSGLLMTDGWAGTNCHWQIDLKGRQALNTPESVFVQDTAVPLDRWVHLAVTYSAPKRMVRFYQDGALVAWRKVERAKPLELGKVWIGCWKLPGHEMDGSVDSLAVFNRAVSDQEVRELFGSVESVTPQQK
jgi:hypothetical protein